MYSVYVGVTPRRRRFDKQELLPEDALHRAKSQSFGGKYAEVHSHHDQKVVARFEDGERLPDEDMGWGEACG